MELINALKGIVFSIAFWFFLLLTIPCAYIIFVRYVLGVHF